MTDRLKDRVVAVTGGGGGIGKGCCLKLADEGAHVLVTDIDGAAAEAVAERIAALGGDAFARPLDVTEEGAAAEAFGAAVDRWGRLDGLVNNAGIMLPRFHFLEFPADAFRRILEINLTGAFLSGQAAARIMAERNSGAIVNMASNSGIFGGAGRAAYGASKAGMINMTQTMAIDLGPHNIRVNAVAPAFIRSETVRADDPPQVLKDRMSIKRMGEPEDVAGIVAFLLSDEARFITGHCYGVDGGFTVTGVPGDGSF